MLVPVCAVLLNRVIRRTDAKMIEQHALVCKNKHRIIDHTEACRIAPGLRLHDLAVCDPVFIAGKDRK